MKKVIFLFIFTITTVAQGQPIWKMWGYDMHHTHRSPIVGSQTNDLLWSRDYHSAIHPLPVISDNGTLYFGVDWDPDWGGYRFFSVSPIDGDENWTYDIGGSVPATAAIFWDPDSLEMNGRIFASSNDGNVYAIAPNGATEWIFYAGGNPGTITLAMDGTLYVSASGILFALSPYDGSVIWQFDTGNSNGNSAPAIDDNGIIYKGSFELLYALDSDGNVLWTFPTNGWIGPPSIGSDGTIYISSDKIYSINSDGSEKWSTAIEGENYYNPPAIASDGTIYIGSGQLYALDPDDGSVIWIFNEGTGVNPYSTPTIGGDGTIYAGGKGVSLFSIDPDGTENWSFDANERLNSPVIGSDGTLYSTSSDDNLYAMGDTLTYSETNVNFSFDLSCYHGIFEELSGGYTPYIRGNWNNWGSIPMSDEDGDHIWTASVDLYDGEYIFYVYASGQFHYFTLLAPVGSECDYYHDDPYGNWGFEINDSTDNELNLPTYSPNSCGECSTNEYFYLTHDGHERFYIVHLPNGYEDLNEDVPLILNLHAYSKYALYQQLMTGMEYWSDMQNIITVYPQAIPGPEGVRAWNCGINGNPDFPTPDVDDVGFISALIDTLVENYSIDPDRIYSCGMSNGGFMSYKLACELNDQITAIGSVTGTFADSDAEECSFERFMPVMDFHGTYDIVVPYFVGDEGWMSVDETVAFWTGHNETDTYETYEYPDIVTGDNSTVNRFTYTNSINNVQVVQYQIVGGGHEWPGAAYNYGWNNYDINAGVELVDFFLQYRLSDFLYVNNNDQLPRRFSLHQNYPNPFNPMTTLSYDLPEDALVNITIYDMMGRQVSMLINSQQSAGYKSVQWNATNNAGQPVSAGLYLYTIQAGEFRQTKKMVLLK